MKLIAHAGDGYREEMYTNSINALNTNKKNFDLFEIDFVTTSDGELVCLHDWELSSNRTFGSPFLLRLLTLTV